jgi:hypothetical protein
MATSSVAHLIRSRELTDLRILARDNIIRSPSHDRGTILKKPQFRKCREVSKPVRRQENAKCAYRATVGCQHRHARGLSRASTSLRHDQERRGWPGQAWTSPAMT